MGDGSKKRGRKTKYRPQMCDTVIECGRRGMGLAEIAAELGVTRDTLWRWRGEHQDFSNAINAARDLALAWWEARGREGTFGEIPGYNSTSYIFQMCNRFRGDWSDVRRSEITGADGGPVKVEGAASRLAEILDGLADE